MQVTFSVYMWNSGLQAAALPCAGNYGTQAACSAGRGNSASLAALSGCSGNSGTQTAYSVFSEVDSSALGAEKYLGLLAGESLEHRLHTQPTWKFILQLLLELFWVPLTNCSCRHRTSTHGQSGPVSLESIM